MPQVRHGEEELQPSVIVSVASTKYTSVKEQGLDASSVQVSDEHGSL